MLSLDERYVGFDTSQLGFPSVDGCHAVVLQTTTGLLGLHNLGGSQNYAYQSKAVAFARFVNGHPNKGVPVCFYSVCFRSDRGYSPVPANGEGWDKEMTAFARQIPFQGPVRGFNLDGHIEGKSSKVGDVAAYVEFHRSTAGVCQIFYKRQRKTKAGTPVNASATNLQFIESKGIGRNSLVAAPSQSVTPYAIKDTFWNKGKMHEIDVTAMDIFNVA